MSLFPHIEQSIRELSRPAPPDSRLVQLPRQKDWTEFGSLGEYKEYKDYMADRIDQEKALLPETDVDLEEIMQTAAQEEGQPTQCSHCQSVQDVATRAFHWYLRPRVKDLSKGHTAKNTYLNEHLCQQCYDYLVDQGIGSKTSPLIGWDRRDAVDGLYFPLQDGPHGPGPT